MASSRIFIRGLPPSLGEKDFKSHFSQQSVVTDAKLFPQRRIGYVGYKTPDEAAKAVKYFNKTFINMSRIFVELAQTTTERSNMQQSKHERRSHHRPTLASSSPETPRESHTSLKRKRGSPVPTPHDPKLQEYIDLANRKSMGAIRANAELMPKSQVNPGVEPAAQVNSIELLEHQSDEEYQALAKSGKRTTIKEPVIRSLSPHSKVDQEAAEEDHEANCVEQAGKEELGDPTVRDPVSDADWLRSRTSRLLGLLDDDEEAAKTSDASIEGSSPAKTATAVDALKEQETEDTDAESPSSIQLADDSLNTEEAALHSSKRLFLRNLAYDVTEDDLRDHFIPYGEIEEVHVPMDPKTGASKGFAYVQYLDGDSAVAAHRTCDGQTFQGRLLHVLPAAAKRESKLDEYAISKLPLKKQKQIRKRAEASASSFTWNALYMNADAVVSSVADRLGVSKAALLDPTSSEAAVKQALAETHVIQETKSYFLQNGVDLEAFKRSAKGDTALLVKNFSYTIKSDELRSLFEEHGRITRFLMPPSGTIAIVEFSQAPQARSAFASLAYRKIKDSILFLEKAPKNLFTRSAEASKEGNISKRISASTAELLHDDQSTEVLDTTTLFVKNLNFSTSSARLAEAFQPLGGFLSARVKTKANPKQLSEPLSMGFGFVEFKSKAQAQTALAAMEGFSLDGHQLVIRASQKNLDAAEDRRREDRAKKLAAQKSKIIIKNLPFETSKKDVRALLKQYGQLRTVRVPKKFDSSARGFAFAEFTSPKEAATAAEALRNTHLLGRKLVIEFAAEDPEDAEAQIERMQKKVGDQTNKVMLQKLLGTGRQKFSANAGETAEED